MNHRHPRPDIRRVLERRERHGLTYREICEESGIPIPTLSYRASKQRRSESFEGPEARLVPIEVEANDHPGAIVIEFEPAVRVTVERGFDEGRLTRVLSVLARS